jgi:hypothetical protein
MRNKKISLFIAGLCTVGATLSLYNVIFTVKTQNELITALTTFCLCIMMTCVSLWDYDYLSKKSKL